jgi:hypothetical protein
MKHQIKLHYPIATLGMIFGMALAYIAFYYGNRMTMALYLEQQDATASKIYQYELPLQCTYNCSYDDMANSFRNISGNVMASGVPLYVDKLDAEHITSVMINQNEVTPFHFIEGDMPEENENPEQLCVVLGKACKKYTKQSQGKDYIRICGEDYLVTGYISAEHSVIYDNTILLFDGRLGEHTKAAIDYYASTIGITLVLQSNTINMNEQYENVAFILEEYNIQANIVDEYEPWFSTELVSTNYRMYAYLTYIFSICIIIMVVEFWILQRRTELAIRRLDGFTTTQIIIMLAIEMAKLLALTTIILFLIQVVLSLVNGEGVNALELTIQLITILTFTICTFALLIIYPIVVIAKGSVADAIQEGGRFS